MNLKDALVNVRAFLPEDKEIIDIIAKCNLYPEGWTKWISASGSYIKISQDNKKLSIKKSNNIDCSNLYAKANPKKTIKISSCAVIYQDIDLNILFYGNDGIIRFIVFSKDKIISKSPIDAGLGCLRFLIKNLRNNSISEKIGKDMIWFIVKDDFNLKFKEVLSETNFEYIKLYLEENV